MLRRKRMTLDELVAQLRAAHGDALLGVVLYGSTAAADTDDGSHNVLVVVRELPVEALRASGAIARAWQEAGHAVPLLFTDAEWRSSADVFAIEHADIADRHRVLHARDGFAVGQRGSAADVRRQLEYETLGLLLAVRGAMGAAGTDEKAQRGVLGANASRAAALCRALLRLRGEDAAPTSAAACERAAAVVGFDAASFVTALAVRRGERPARAEIEAALRGFHDGLGRLAAFVDGL